MDRIELDRRGLSFWLGIIAGVVLLGSLGAVVLAETAVHRQDQARTKLLDRVGPTRNATLQLETAVNAEETGVRGYLLGGDTTFLEPYTRGVKEERTQLALIRTGIRAPEFANARALARALETAIAAWHRDYADPAIDRVRGGQRTLVSEADLRLGKQRFDEIRDALAALRVPLDATRMSARTGLNDAANATRRYLLLAGILIALAAIAAAIVLRRGVIVPLSRLGRDVRAVAAGDFDKELSSDGPREIAMLATDVDGMRGRIVEELAAIRLAEERLREQATELERSNAELEQFAYVASHDLQEPLRKIVSFNQMLERRYKGQLDERADQYIGFAVDGARRMQVLINDLLAFSRVGRIGEAQKLLPARRLVDEAISGLRVSIDELDATVDVGELPNVHVDPSLMTLVFQNLIGNALKFRGEAPPTIAIRSRQVNGDTEISVADNGIGISEEYAERIFVIFQRLHPRAEYEGTGIGLAMCRKIVEYHGGRIWVDTDVTEGSTFRFTLPAVEESSE